MLVSYNSFIKTIGVLLLVLPRVTLTYPIYALGVLSVFKVTKKHDFIKILFSFTLLFFIALINSFFFKVSLVAFVIELFLIFPFILMVIDVGFRGAYVSSIQCVRFINIVILILSIFSLVGKGFPFKLPYIHYAPDFYNAMYGLGGAKIVTIIGYFGLLLELGLGKNKRLKYVLIASSNFIIPSYILGIVVGFLSLTPFIRKNKIFFVLSVICATIIIPYIIFRYSTLGFGSIFDNPKIEGLNSIFSLFIQYPSAILLGTGLGQYIGQAALWSSPYIAELSTHSIPNIPLFYMSEFHQNIYGPILSSRTNFWDISSSAQKPFSSLVAIVGEFGLFLTLLIVFGFGKQLLKIKFLRVRISLALFIIGMFFVDIWHDSYFFMFMLINIIIVFSKEPEFND